jgi:hypothetical protein
MTSAPRLSIATVVLDCIDAHGLAEFYCRLLGWEITFSEPGWVLLRSPYGGTGLAFQSEPWYQPPVWPEEPSRPHKMLHMDFRVNDLESGEAHALAVGATLAAYQPQDGVRVFLDPAGHPFCLFVD